MNNKDEQYNELWEKYQILLEENESLQNRQQLLYKQYREISNSDEYKMGKHLKNIKSNPKAIISLSKKVPKYIKKLIKKKTKSGKVANQISIQQTANQVIESYTKLKKNKDFILRDIQDFKELKIGCIMDEFSYMCFKEEAYFIPLTPDEWKNEIQGIDFLFVESAWRGKDDLWRKKISIQDRDFLGLIEYCNENNIPTIFWNKEDPVNFDIFIEVATLFDVIFTTDSDMIPQYKEKVGHDKVYHLHFAAQPKVHNPIESYIRKEACCFAGSYYMKYPERQLDFGILFDAISSQMPVQIYDRNYNKNIASFMFPEKYKKFILGNLPPEEIDKAYKGYRYNLNMNSVKYSNTMFARRVFELLASNTVVVSNYARGIKNLLGQVVICSDKVDDIKRELIELQQEEAYLAFRAKGLREVLSKHLYEDRLREIVNIVFSLDTERDAKQIDVFSVVSNTEELLTVKEQFEKQTYKNKRLILLTKNDVKCQEHKNITYEVAYQTELRGISKSPYIAFISAECCYGENYLLDLMLGFKYTQTNVVCKGEIGNPTEWYKYTSRYNINSALIKVVEKNCTIEALLEAKTRTELLAEALMIDGFEYMDHTGQRE